MLTDLVNPGVAPAVRRPVVEIDLGGPGGGLLGAAASALAGAGDPWRASLVAVVVRRCLAPAVDVAELWVAPTADLPALGLGDRAAVRLGYADTSVVAVFAGEIAGIGSDVAGATRLTLANGGAALARHRLNQSFEALSAGDIAAELASAAGVDTATVVAGNNLPFYVIDDRRSAYRQIATLAARSGCIALITPENALAFVAPQDGEPSASFTYGTDVLALSVRDQRAAAGRVTVWGEGAAGSQGQDAWSWPVKDATPVTAESGTGKPAKFVTDRSLRSRDAVGPAADAGLARTAAAGVAGRLVVPGAPELAPGEIVKVADAPRPSADARFRVASLSHRFDLTLGFTTELRLARVNGTGGGLL